VLRFHPRCPFVSGMRHPCLLALMRNATTDVPTGIQRIALTADANKIDRRMLGQAGVVKLWTPNHQLVVGEGLETTLAAATRIPYDDAPLQPAWALLSAGKLRTLPTIANVKRLIVLVDHDDEGLRAADFCEQRWIRAGHTVVQLIPEQPGADFNDIVLEDFTV